MIFSRLAQGALLLFLLSVLCFALFQLAPGDAVSDLRLDPRLSPQTIEQIRAQRGLNSSWPERYLRWIASLSAGDGGISLLYQRPVRELVAPRAGRTLLLNVTALAAVWCAVLPLAYLRARRSRSATGRAGAGAAYALVAAPDLLIALAALWFAMHTGWLPTGGSFLLCSLCLALLLFPSVFRHAEAAFREALRLPYVLNALGAGLGGLTLALFWVLPAAAGPLLALLGLQLSAAFSASLIVEVVLGWPGLGPLLLEAVLGRDYPVLAAAVLLSGAALIAGNLMADLLQRAFDPRVRGSR